MNLSYIEPDKTYEWVLDIIDVYRSIYIEVNIGYFATNSPIYNQFNQI